MESVNSSAAHSAPDAAQIQPPDVTSPLDAAQLLGTVNIPPQLKFLMSTINNVITIQLTPDNHLTWKSQVLKVFRANGFEGYLDGTILRPPPQLTSANGSVISNPLYSTWLLIDQNLAAALFSTISASLLPYVLHLDSCSEIWQTIGKRLQSSNRSKILQLKNDLNFISMGSKNMQ
ncbi:hypothetical protein KFK09_012628 [Dendrobium nobile]|uniref:Retrotransposon Copia-like N-terminal domain-containing protein n=1 Tax=Dendrobium nobile TaxID=94219 RepID=A0A8T3BI00_DENNO|nr:hypothetical protein KFK09_012628 [Dendrobium nobile]